MSDLLHDEVDDVFLARVFGVMAMALQHTFRVLTKRSDRMRQWVGEGEQASRVLDYVRGYWAERNNVPFSWPLPNVWLGVLRDVETLLREGRAAREARALTEESVAEHLNHLAAGAKAYDREALKHFLSTLLAGVTLGRAPTNCSLTTALN